MPTTGSIAIRHTFLYYRLYFAHYGWLAAEMAQYVDDILTEKDPQLAILKLLGYTVEILPKAPSRDADHWLEIDVEKRILYTNSKLIRKAVEKMDPDAQASYSPAMLTRLHDVLDRNGFSVELFGQAPISLFCLTGWNQGEGWRREGAWETSIDVPHASSLRHP